MVKVVDVAAKATADVFTEFKNGWIGDRVQGLSAHSLALDQLGVMQDSQVFGHVLLSAVRGLGKAANRQRAIPESVKKPEPV